MLSLRRQKNMTQGFWYTRNYNTTSDEGPTPTEAWEDRRTKKVAPKYQARKYKKSCTPLTRRKYGKNRAHRWGKGYLLWILTNLFSLKLEAPSSITTSHRYHLWKSSRLSEDLQKVGGLEDSRNTPHGTSMERAMHAERIFTDKSFHDVSHTIDFTLHSYWLPIEK